MKNKQPLILCILDGWGYRKDPTDNAVALADTPCFDQLWETEPKTFLKTCGTDVGLPEKQMGNSEVGHMNLGAGRIVLQDLPMIDHGFTDHSIEKNPHLSTFVKQLKKSKGVCHLMGLLSPGGVHSHERHMLQMAKILEKQGLVVYIHAFMDGRDTPPMKGKDYLKKFMNEIKDYPNIKIVTLCGRYFAMDRDKRWQRIEVAYQAIRNAIGSKTAHFGKSLTHFYKETGKGDEFVTPFVSQDYQGMKDGDGLFMVNFRSDRVRELLSAFLLPDFDGFHIGKPLKFAAKLGMMSYADYLDPYLPALFPPKKIENSLGEVISKAGLKQLRIAETEKYAHVTFFFNGGDETVFEGEDRLLIPSPQVATYDLQPEMSAHELTTKLLQRLDKKTYDLIVLNFANPDMVGHTGNLDAAIQAVETVDECLEKITTSARKNGYGMLITADHGNCETMKDLKTGEPMTSHTLNKVPLIFYNLQQKIKKLSEGRLADIAPTILNLMNLPIPPEMKGVSLVENADGSKRK